MREVLVSPEVMYGFGTHTVGHSANWTHHKMRIPERDMTYIDYLGTYLRLSTYLTAHNMDPTQVNLIQL